MALEPHLRPDLILILDSCGTREALFDEICRAVNSHIPALDVAALKAKLIEREEQVPTSTPEGVAFPHALSPEIDTTLVVVARVKGGVTFGQPEHPPADLVFCMFGPSKSPWEHVRLLARLARLVHTEHARQSLRDATDAQALYDRLVTEDRAHA